MVYYDPCQHLKPNISSAKWMWYHIQAFFSLASDFYSKLNSYMSDDYRTDTNVKAAQKAPLTDQKAIRSYVIHVYSLGAIKLDTVVLPKVLPVYWSGWKKTTNSRVLLRQEQYLPKSCGCLVSKLTVQPAPRWPWGSACPRQQPAGKPPPGHGSACRPSAGTSWGKETEGLCSDLSWILLAASQRFTWVACRTPGNKVSFIASHFIFEVNSCVPSSRGKAEGELCWWSPRRGPSTNRWRLQVEGGQAPFIMILFSRKPQSLLRLAFLFQ